MRFYSSFGKYSYVYLTQCFKKHILSFGCWWGFILDTPEFPQLTLTRNHIYVKLSFSLHKFKIYFVIYSKGASSESKY